MSHAPFHFLFNWPGDPAEPQRDHRINPHANCKADHWARQSRRVILSGQLIYADTPPHHVDCVVLELCPGGARIEMIQAANIPDYLFFRIGNSPPSARCIAATGRGTALNLDISTNSRP